MQTTVLIKEECILKNKNKSYPYKKLSVFYNSCLKTFGSHLVCVSNSVLQKMRVVWSHGTVCHPTVLCCVKTENVVL